MLFRSDRKSTRLNSSHLVISYAVFCLKKKTTNTRRQHTTSTLQVHSESRLHALVVTAYQSDRRICRLWVARNGPRAHEGTFFFNPGGPPRSPPSSPPPRSPW